MPPKPHARGAPKSSSLNSAAGKNAAGFTAREQRFVTELLTPGMSATEAATRAGYNQHSARTMGPRLVKRPAIKAAIEAGRAKQAARLEITAERTLAELAAVAYSDMRNVVEWGPEGVRIKSSAALSIDAAAAVSEVSETATQSGISRRVKLHDKVAALSLLMKHQGLGADRLEVSGPRGGPIEVTDARDRISSRIARVAANLAAGSDSA